jgi:hypothetical protein
MMLVRISLHILLILLITTKILVWNYSTARYIRALQQTFAFLFTTPEPELPESQRYELFSYNETKEFVSKLVSNYKDIQDLSVAAFRFGSQDSAGNIFCEDEPVGIHADSCFWKNPTSVHCENSFIDAANENIDDFPFYHGVDMRTFFQSVDYIKLTLNYCHYPNQQPSYSNPCDYWKINVWLKSISQMYLEVTVESSLLQSCNDNNAIDDALDRFTVWCDMIIIVVAGIYLYYNLQVSEKCFCCMIIIIIIIIIIILTIS